jgi:predicted nicotinamide N-methyase
MSHESHITAPAADTTVRLGGRDWTFGAVPDSDILLRQVETEAEMETFPYGLLLWPSAIGLAERLIAEPSLVAGKRVLELGAGVGLPGLIAQHLGALVTQTDYQEAPLVLARQNAERNGVEGIVYQTLDWRHPPDLAPFEVVLASDVLYERSLHQVLFDLLPLVVAADGLLLLADPMRPKAIAFVDQLEAHGWAWQIEGRAVPWQGSTKEIAIFTARRS